MKARLFKKGPTKSESLKEFKAWFRRELRKSVEEGKEVLEALD